MVDIITPSETFSNSGNVSNMDQSIGNSLQCVSIFYQALEFRIIIKKNVLKDIVIVIKYNEKMTAK